MSAERDLERRTVRATLAARVLLIAVVILAAVIVTLQLTQTIRTNEVTDRIREQQIITAGSVETIEELAEQIKSCTTPALPCFEDAVRRDQANDARAAQAVASVNRVIVLAAACADQTGAQTQRQIAQCVKDALYR